MKIEQRITAFLNMAFSTREIEFGQRNLILVNAAKAAGFTLRRSGHGAHCDIINFEICSGRRMLACFK